MKPKPFLTCEDMALAEDREDKRQTRAIIEQLNRERRLQWSEHQPGFQVTGVGLLGFFAKVLAGCAFVWLLLSLELVFSWLGQFFDGIRGVFSR